MLGFDVLELTDAAPTGASITAATPLTLDLLRAPYGLALDGVDLGVSRARPGSLGGAGLYEEVPVTLPITINGDCAADVYAAHAQLIGLLEQAQAWKGDQQTPVVRLVAQAIGSRVAPVSAVVLRLRDAGAAVIPPTVYEADDGQGYVAQVTLQFMRRGAWLLTEAAVTATGQRSGDVASLAFSSGVVSYSPVRIGWTGAPTAAASSNNNAATIVVSDSVSASGGTVSGASLTAAAKLRIFNAATFGAGAPFTLQNEAANGARGTNVLRFTPAGASGAAGPITVSPAFDARRTLIYGVVRNNNTALSYQVQWTALGAITGTSVASTIQPIDVPDSRPHAVYLGALLTPFPIAQLIAELFASGTGGTLDIDYFVLVNADDPATTHILTFSPSVSYNSTNELVADPRPLVAPTPSFGVTSSVGGAVAAPQTWLGDAFGQTRGQNLAGVLLQPDGITWRASYSTANSWLLRAVRHLAYLTLP